VVVAEDQGFTHAWFYDAQTLYSDVYVCLAMAAERTTRIKLGTGEEIAAGELKVLPLEDGGDVFGEIYLVLADPEGAGLGSNGWRRFSSRTCGASVPADPAKAHGRQGGRPGVDKKP